MSNIKRFIVIVVLTIIALFVLGNNSNTNAASTDAVIKFEKSTYDENTNKLSLWVKTYPGINLYTFDISYDTSVLSVSNITVGDNAEIPISNSNVVCTPGLISVQSEELDDGAVTTINGAYSLLIEAELLPTTNRILEENIPDNLFNVRNVTVIDENGDDLTNSSLIEIGNNGSLKKTVSSIQASNIMFEKSMYDNGETINAVSGTLTINYDNAASTTGTTRTVDIATLEDTNNNNLLINSSDLIKGGWTANCLDPYVNLSYKGVLSPDVQVNVKDIVKRIQIEDNVQKEYEYGDQLNVNDSKVYIDLDSGRRIETTLNELINEGKVTIGGFNSTAAPKETVQQQLTITINLPEFNNYIATANFVQVTILPSNYIEVNVPANEENNVTDNLTEVTIADLIKSIQWMILPKKDYKYGENLDTTNGKFEAKYGSNQTKEINLTNEMVTEEDGSPFDSTNLTTRNLLVTYKYVENNEEKSKTLKYEINVSDYVVNTEIVDDVKKVYEYGENFDIGNTKVKIKLASQTTPIEKDLQEMINNGEAIIDDVDTTENPREEIYKIVNITIKLPEYNYEETKELAEIKIYDPVEEIQFSPAPSKVVYEYNEDDLDVSNGQIEITYKSDNLNNNSEKNKIAIMTSMVKEEDNTQFDNTKIGTRNLKVSYSYRENDVSKSKELKYEIKVTQPMYEISLNNYEIEIEYGHQIDNSDLLNYKIIIDKGNNIEEKQLTENYIGQYDKTKIGLQTIYLTYDYEIDGEEYSKQLPFYITIKNQLEKIELTKDIIEIIANENIKQKITDEYKIIPILANGDQEEEIQLEEIMIIGDYDITHEGTYNVQVEYKGKYANLQIKVLDEIIGINFDEGTMKKIYKYGEELDLTGAKIIISKSSGQEYIINLNKDTIKDFKLIQLGKQEYDLAYYENIMKNAIKIEVEDYIVDIILTKPNKTTYVQTEKELDLTGAKVQLVMASGAILDPVDVNLEMISGYDKDALGVQKIKVTYEGFEKEFEIIKNVQTGIDGIYLPDILIGIILISILSGLYIIKKEKRKRNE